MKTQLAALIFALGFATHSFAGPAPAYEGDFKIDPTGASVHKTEVTGKMTLVYENDAITEVQMKFDQKIVGKDAYASTEQFTTLVSTNGSVTQMGLTFKLKGPPHKWYYVGVLDSADNGLTFTGKIYKVNRTIADLQTLLTAGITTDPTDATLNPTDAKNWELVGTSTLKKL